MWKKYGKRISRKFETSKLNEEKIYFDNRHCSFCYDLNEKKWLDGKGYNPKVKSILTKEEFNSRAYKIEQYWTVRKRCKYVKNKRKCKLKRIRKVWIS